MKKRWINSIFFAYESGCGGETVATDAIIKEFKKLPHLTTLSYSLPPLVHTDFLRFFSWVFGSIFRWIFILNSHKRVEVIYTTTFTAGVAASLLKPFRSFRIVWHFHGNRIPPPAVGIQGKVFVTQAVKHLVVLHLHTFFLKHVDLVIVPSQESKQWLKAHITHIDAQKIQIVPNGFDNKKFHPISHGKKQILKKKYHIKNNTFVVLAVGRLEKQKGLELLLPVIKKMSITHASIRLYIVYPKMIREQEQRYKEVLNQIIVKMKLTTIVYFVEDPNTLEDFYHIADCTVSLSRLEFFPLTMLESIGCQTPYFGFPNGINKMLLPPIDTRLLIKTKAPQIISSQISTFFLSNIKRREIAERGLQVVKDYTWEHTALKLYALCSKEIYHI